MIIARLLGGLLFSTIGLVAFRHGRSRGGMRAIGIGAALMVYPYFVPNAIALYVIGTALVAGLFIFRD